MTTLVYRRKLFPDLDVKDVKRYHKEAEQGLADSQHKLGLMYFHGEGVPRDHDEGFKWFRKAAEQGHADAQVALGLRWHVPLATPQLHMEAYMWYNLAAAQGHEGARRLKDILAKEMTKEQIAEAQKMSREWLEKHSK